MLIAIYERVGDPKSLKVTASYLCLTLISPYMATNNICLTQPYRALGFIPDI